MATDRAIAEALARVTRYVEMRQKVKFRGLDDQIHGIHTGTEYEASLNLSDLETLVAAWNRRAPGGAGDAWIIEALTARADAAERDGFITEADACRYAAGKIAARTNQTTTTKET